MSLLLEALKKAERAKEEAQRRAQGESEGAAALQLESAPAAAAKPVLTRDQLPDIRQPLEIVSDDLEASAPAPERPRPAPEPAAAPRERAGPQRTADAQAPERAAARKVFEAKFREPNPRLPFFIALGALGTFALGTVIYFWIQLRPPSPLVNTTPRPAGETQVAAAGKPAASAAAAQPSMPGLPGGALPAVPAAPGAAPKAPAGKPAPQFAPRETEVPLLKPAPRTSPAAARAPGAPSAAQPPGAEVASSRPLPQVHPMVSSGYAAYLAGDLAKARTDYQEALREEPANRDATLGLAAVDVRTGRYEAAAAAYLRLLQADPRDAHAQAALMALRGGGRGDPVAAESRVKSMLANNPDAHVLHFTLGNQLAQQGRWAEAQQEYFKALAAEPDNPDFAYNLAVSLDHLRQPKLALEYYQRALALAKSRGASFDLAATQARAAQLER